MYIVRVKVNDGERGVAMVDVNDMRDAHIKAVAHVLETEGVEGVAVDSLYVPEDTPEEEVFQRIDEWYVTTHGEKHESN